MSSFDWPPTGSGGGGGVTSVNSVTGDVSVIAGPGISVSTAGQNITVSGQDPTTQVSLFEDFLTGYYSDQSDPI